jgi:hypothetical protein
MAGACQRLARQNSMVLSLYRALTCSRATGTESLVPSLKTGMNRTDGTDLVTVEASRYSAGDGAPHGPLCLAGIVSWIEVFQT